MSFGLPNECTLISPDQYFAQKAYTELSSCRDEAPAVLRSNCTIVHVLCSPICMYMYVDHAYTIENEFVQDSPSRLQLRNAFCTDEDDQMLLNVIQN